MAAPSSASGLPIGPDHRALLAAKFPLRPGSNQPVWWEFLDDEKVMRGELECAVKMTQVMGEGGKKEFPGVSIHWRKGTPDSKSGLKPPAVILCEPFGRSIDYVFPFGNAEGTHELTADNTWVKWKSKFEDVSVYVNLDLFPYCGSVATPDGARNRHMERFFAWYERVHRYAVEALIVDPKVGAAYKPRADAFRNLGVNATEFLRKGAEHPKFSEVVSQIMSERAPLAHERPEKDSKGEVIKEQDPQTGQFRMKMRPGSTSASADKKIVWDVRSDGGGSSKKAITLKDRFDVNGFRARAAAAGKEVNMLMLHKLRPVIKDGRTEIQLHPVPESERQREFERWGRNAVLSLSFTMRFGGQGSTTGYVHSGKAAMEPRTILMLGPAVNKRPALGGDRVLEATPGDDAYAAAFFSAERQAEDPKATASEVGLEEEPEAKRRRTEAQQVFADIGANEFDSPGIDGI